MLNTEVIKILKDPSELKHSKKSVVKLLFYPSLILSLACLSLNKKILCQREGLFWLVLDKT